jgi:hypothetical protein
MWVKLRNSQKSVFAEEYPARNEPGQFFFILRSETDERRRRS